MSIKNQVTASFAQIANYDASGNITGITVPAANLGAVGNLVITGGSNLQFLQTNGSGNLSWATVSSNSLTNGNSNVVVTANSNVTISSNGVPNVLVVSSTGANISGTANVTGNLVAGNISAGSFSTAGNISASIVSVTGNITTSNYFIGNGACLTGITTAAAGSNTQIQYNSNGAFAGSNNLTYVNSTGTLSVQGQYLQSYYNGSNSTYPTFRGYNARGTNTAPTTVLVGDDIFRIRSGGYTGNGNLTLNGQAGWTDNSLLWSNVAGIAADSSNIASNLYLQTTGLSGNSQVCNRFVLDNTGSLTVPANVNANQFFGALVSSNSTNGSSNIVFDSSNANITFSAAGFANAVTITGNVGNATLNNSFIIGSNTTANLGVLNNWQIRANSSGVLIPPTAGSTLSYNGSFWAFSKTIVPQLGVSYATTAQLTATYNNGTAGVGATLTNNIFPFVVLTIDGVVPFGRVLVKNQSSAAQNGVYDVTFIGSTVSPWILTRVTDFDTSEEMLPGSLFYVSSGNTLSNTYWSLLDAVPTVGSSAVNFTSAGVATLQNVTAGGNTTTLPVSFSGNTSNAIITTTIANGNVLTGNGFITGADSGNLLTIAARNSQITGNSNYNMIYTGTNAGELRIGGPAVPQILTLGVLQANGVVAASQTALQLRPTASEVRFLPVVGAGVTSANLRFETVGTGNVIIAAANLKISSNITNQTVVADQVITIGASDAGNSANPVVVGLQTANATYGGYRWSKAAGTEVAYLGLDSSANVGNFLINTNGTTPFFIQTGNSSATNYNTVIQTKGFAEYYANSVSIVNAADTVITAYNVQTTDTTGLTLSSGVWTNNTGRTLQVMITVQGAWAANATGVRVQYVAKSAPPTTVRYLMADLPTNSDFPVTTTSGTMQLTSGESFRVVVYQNSGGSLNFGAAAAAMSANASSRVTITVL